jgi:hypothetical protein
VKAPARPPAPFFGLQKLNASPAGSRAQARGRTERPPTFEEALAEARLCYFCGGLFKDHNLMASHVRAIERQRRRRLTRQNAQEQMTRSEDLYYISVMSAFAKPAGSQRYGYNRMLMLLLGVNFVGNELARAGESSSDALDRVLAPRVERAALRIHRIKFVEDVPVPHRHYEAAELAPELVSAPALAKKGEAAVVVLRIRRFAQACAALSAAAHGLDPIYRQRRLYPHEGSRYIRAAA